jgi:hypothetical protein
VGLRFDSTEISHLLTPVQLPPIYLTDLPVERPQVVEQADAHQPTGEQVDNPGDPLAHVEAVDAEYSQEGEQHPGHSVVQGPSLKAEVGPPIHAGDQEKVDNPANQQQAAGEEPDRSGDRLAVVEPVRSQEPEDPENVADQDGVGVVGVRHISVSSRVLRGSPLGRQHPLVQLLR